MSQASDADRVIAAAVSAGVRTLLVYDATAETLAAFAARLAGELTSRRGAARVVQLGGREDDEALFGSWAPRGEGELSLGWHPGALDPGDGDVIAILPDLSRSDRELRRAVLMTTAGGAVHVERHGQQRRWPAHIWWLVGCPRARIGAVAPHLIDRFAVRLRAEPPGRHSVESLRRFVEDGNVVVVPPAPLPSPSGTASGWPAVEDAALERALAVVRGAGRGAPDVRRALALVRLAIAEVRQRGEPSVGAAEIDRSAAAIDAVMPSPGTPAPRPDAAPEREDDDAAPPRTSPDGADRAPRQRPGPGVIDGAPVKPSDRAPRPAPNAETVSRVAAPAGESRFPEDSAPVLRGPQTLRLSFAAQLSLRRGRGRVLGSEPADALTDLALVDTVLAAVRRRCLQARPDERRPDGARPPLRLAPSDLRRNRRAPVPEDLLVIVLDHTALEGWPWDRALTRHLRIAYANRSRVALIQVGAAVPGETTAGAITAAELRARRRQVRNVRSAELIEAMSAPRGRATPLAHGLALAADAIRAAATHGRGHASRVSLVVITDGRGNVPLADSHSGRLSGPVRTEGVRDALDKAKEIGALRLRGQAVVLHRRVEEHADLPIKLAEALGGVAMSPAPRPGAAP